MKKIFTTLLIVFSFSFCKAQWVTIPDANFVAWLQVNYPGCMNGNLMDTTCSGIVNATSLSIPGFGISNLSGIQYFDSATFLSLSSSGLNFIPAFPPNILWVDLSDNNLTSIPSIPNSLGTLYVSTNNLNSLPSLNQIHSLDCGANPIAALPSLPNSLQVLDCSGCPLTSLPTLPDSLVELTCDFCNLVSLPLLPNSMTNLSCINNSLSVLPQLPSSLQSLICSGNSLTALPQLPSTLFQLICSNNAIVSLPELPIGTESLICDGNNLNEIPILSPVLYEFNCSNNNGVTCLPNLPITIDVFDISGTNINCIPNYINPSSSNPPMSSLVLCDLFNSNGCDVYWNIFGKIYFDSNSNCIYDASDLTQSNIQVQLWQAGNLLQQTFTVGGGTYSFDVNTFGTYEVKIDTTTIPFSVLCPSGGIQTSIITAIDSMDSNVDFALVCKPDYDVAVNSVAQDSGWIATGRKSLINIHAGDFANFYGANCMNGIGGQLQVIINGAAQYAGYKTGSLAPTTVAGNTITWSIADFGSVDFFHDFHIRLLTDTSAILGSQVCIDATITSNPADINQINNQLNQCFTVLSSFDPNVKEVSPAELNSTNDYLTYTIHFQNTGTAPAQHIQIIDTLDSDFDLSSFQLLAYSHPNMTQVLEGGIVHFNFPNINLPDSGSNEPLSHGYIQYKIKPKSNTPLTSSFENTANIYFDFNSPVVTNTTHTSFATGISQLTIDHSQFTIFPNPANESVTIQLSFPCENCSIEISNTLGQIFIRDKLNHNSKILNLKSLPPGLYFCIVKTEDGKMMQQKLVVAK